MKSILSIVESAYRATQEEQDDSVLWLTHALRNAGAEIGVLLTGSATSYAVIGQDAAGMVIGSKAIERPPCPNHDLLAMQKAGIPVYVVREEMEERGISAERVERGFDFVSREGVPELLSRFEQVWHW